LTKHLRRPDLAIFAGRLTVASTWWVTKCNHYDTWDWQL